MTDVALPGTGQLQPKPVRLRRRLIGYRSSAVEARLAEMSMQLEAERVRAEAAEAALADTRAALAAARHRPPATLGDLAMHTARIHREAGREAEAIVTAARRTAKETVRAAEIEAAQILRKARHHAMDGELRAKDLVERAEAEKLRLETDARRDADRKRARATSEARLVLAEANAGVEMVRAEWTARLNRLRETVQELEAVRTALVANTRTQQDSLAEVIERLGGD